MKLTFENFLDNNAATEQLIVIYPGRFQPAHKNHAKVYNFLVNKFPTASVFVATSNVLKLPKSPFTFEEKKIMLVAAGVPANAIIQTANPYVAREITQQFNLANSKLIFAVGGKDMLPEAPRFNFLPTKKGDAYFKPLKNIKTVSKEQISNMFTADKHGYVAATPTFNFSLNINGHDIKITGASEIREIYSKSSEAGRKNLIFQLYGTFNEKIYNLFNKRLA